jgi:hypothetical protein
LIVISHLTSRQRGCYAKPVFLFDPCLRPCHSIRLDSGASLLWKPLHNNVECVCWRFDRCRYCVLALKKPLPTRCEPWKHRSGVAGISSHRSAGTLSAGIQAAPQRRSAQYVFHGMIWVRLSLAHHWSRIPLVNLVSVFASLLSLACCLALVHPSKSQMYNSCIPHSNLILLSLTCWVLLVV